MTTPPTTMPQPPQSSQPAPSPAAGATAPARRARPARFGFFFGIAATAVTLAAIALAVFAPALTSAPQLQVPQGWQQVYNANPADANDVWGDTSGCSFPTQGLDVSSDSSCLFTPANTSGGLLNGGVLVVAKLAPAAAVSLSQDAAVVLGNSLIVVITQEGDYQICQDTCDLFSESGRVLASGSTVAWHADAFVPNELAVLYNSDQNSVSFYANGQFVDQVSAGIGSSLSVALGTSTNGEALYTHVAIYAPSVG